MLRIRLTAARSRFWRGSGCFFCKSAVNTDAQRFGEMGVFPQIPSLAAFAALCPPFRWAFFCLIQRQLPLTARRSALGLL